MRSIRFSVATTSLALLLVACGSSPTEPASSQGPRTTVTITVTRCDLGGSVLVLPDGYGNAPVTLPTPGEVTFSLTPGPHSLAFQRGNQTFGGNTLGAADPLGVIPPGAMASIVLVDPLAACMAAPH